MEEHPEAMTKTSDEGVERAQRQNYAFLMESTSIEYEVEGSCSLAQVGGQLDDKGYGIIMRKGNHSRTKFYSQTRFNFRGSV